MAGSGIRNMRTKPIILAAMAAVLITGCGGNQHNTSSSGGADSNDDPSRWAPSEESKKEYQQWKASAGAAGIIMNSSSNPAGIVGEPMQWTAADRASQKQLERNKLYEQAHHDPEYDANPRAWEEKHGLADDENSSTEPDDESAPQQMPPPIALQPLTSGDEADQYGLPEWEKIARGDLHIKRIQY